MIATLPNSQAARFAELERVVSNGLRSYLEVAEALEEIHEKKLYRAKWPSFETYCQKRWKISRARAYQIIQFATVQRELSTSVDNRPINEAQIRPLSGLNPIDRQEAWERACEEAGGGQPTGAEVERAVAAVLLARHALECLPAEQQLDVIQTEERRVIGKAEDILERRRVENAPVYYRKAHKTLEKFTGIVESLLGERAKPLLEIVARLREELMSCQ